MSPEQPQFSLETELNKLQNIAFKPVPSDKKIGEAAYCFSQIDDHGFLNIEKPMTAANQAFLETKRCNLTELNLSENDLEILQNLEKRGYIFTLVQGDRVCNLETRLYPRNESKLKNQEIIAPNEDQIVDIYTQILTQVLDFEQNQAAQIRNVEKGFAKAFSLLKNSFSDVAQNQDYTQETRANFYEAETKLLELARILDQKLEFLPKISSFIKVSASQLAIILKNKEKIAQLNQLLGNEKQIKTSMDELLGFWCANIFLKNIQVLISNSDIWRSGINFFQARDARITSDGKVEICHLEEVKVLAPYVSQARIIADALKIASKQDIESGTINIESRISRLNQLTTFVTNIEGVDKEAFDLALKSVLLDTLTDIIKDAADELNPENGYLSCERLEQAKNSTFALIQVILERLELIKQN